MFKLLALISLLFIAACGGSSLSDIIEAIEEPDRKQIDTSIVGVNAFVNDDNFGGKAAQFREIRDTLRLNYVRVLFNWSDSEQATSSSKLNFELYDLIIDALPSNMEALVVLSDLPSWMTSSNNWVGGNPRTTFVQNFVKEVATHYASNPRVVGFQIWNEPNQDINPDNTTLGIADNPENYVEMLGAAFSVIRDVAPGKLVLNAATTAINQDFPETVNYNRKMRDAGAQNFVDKWAIHYYGKQFENVVRNDGIEDFLDGLTKGVWVTESGNQGVNSQLAYVEQVWPYLREKAPNIERFYYYQFAENTPAASTYGLRNLTAGLLLSDLYVWLRDR